MSRRKMSKIGTEAIRKLIEDTGLSRTELAKLLGATLGAINIWVSRGRIPEDVMDKIMVIVKDRRKTKRLVAEDGIVMEAEVTELTPERISELSKKGDAINVIRGRTGLLGSHPVPLRKIKLETLVAEIERRGWTVALSLKGNDGA